MLQADAKTSAPVEPVIRYYKSFAGYNIPLKLIGQMSEEDAKVHGNTASVYIGYFDGNERLFKVIKRMQTEIWFIHEYEYYPSGKIKSNRITDEKGAVHVNEYDESGKLKKKK
jgi:hypothetical protein